MLVIMHMSVIRKFIASTKMYLIWGSQKVTINNTKLHNMKFPLTIRQAIVIGNFETCYWQLVIIIGN